MSLVQPICWTYTSQEWNSFMRWKQKRRGWFYFLLHRINFFSFRQAPLVQIGGMQVWINQDQIFFQNSTRQFLDVSVRQAGNLHIMEIWYEQHCRKMQITIPVPKGKLKEAFECQDWLLLESGSAG